MNKNRTDTRKMAECALLIAASVMLSFIKMYEAPLGGSVTLFSMVPLMLVSLRHGLGWGLGSSFIYGIIELLLGASVISPVRTPIGLILVILLDYYLAFTSIGLAGIFRKVKFSKNNKVSVAIGAFCGVLLACLARFVCHFISGAVVWYEITKGGGWNDYVQTVGMWLYSFVYNITYLGPETVMALIAVPVMVTVLNIMKKNTRNSI
jgi:thiamine transporter